MPPVPILADSIRQEIYNAHAPSAHETRSTTMEKSNWILIALKYLWENIDDKHPATVRHCSVTKTRSNTVAGMKKCPH